MKSKKTKKALTGSVLALVLCFVMLLGTTFAWFTDTASTGVNKIQAGNLKIELLDKEGNDLEGQTLKFIQDNGDNETTLAEEVLWEPGCTYELQKVTVKNAGNLALKYKIVVSGVDGSAKLNEAITWTVSAGTNAVTDSAGEYYLTAGGADEITITGTMDKDAGNEYQGLSISGVSVIVAATQYTYEFDSTTDQYDKDAAYDIIPVAPTKDEKGVYHITNAAEFMDFITKLNTDAYHNVSVVLDTDIDLGGTKITRAGKYYSYANFDGKGHTVSNFSLEAHDDETGLSFASLFGGIDGQVTIKNLTVRNADIKGDAWVGVIAGASYNGNIENCKVYDSTVTGDKKVGTIVGYLQGKSATNCYAEDSTVYYIEKQGGEILGYKGDSATESGNSYENVTVSQSIASGVVLSGDTYCISSAEGMEWFMNLGTEGQYNKNITLTADIDLKNVAWTPICDSHTQYGGTFDGNGHTIYNLKIDGSAATGNEATGLFAWSNGTIKNLTIDGANVTGNHWVGALVGYVQAGTIENCTVKNATVKSDYKDSDRDGDKAGALVGYVNQGTLNTKVNNCKAVDCEISAVRDAGQLVGCADANDVTNCTATNVTVTTITGYEKSGNNVKNAIVGRS